MTSTQLTRTGNVPGGALVAMAGFEAQDYVTLYVGDQMFGIPILQVQDVLQPQRITRIPLAPGEVAGALNLRGRIVTAIDLRARLGLPPSGTNTMSIVVEHKGELYSLLVDRVGDVMLLPHRDLEANPPTLDVRWREVSGGIFRLDGTLMVVFDIAQLLGFADSGKDA